MGLAKTFDVAAAAAIFLLLCPLSLAVQNEDFPAFLADLALELGLPSARVVGRQPGTDEQTAGWARLMSSGAKIYLGLGGGPREGDRVLVVPPGAAGIEGATDTAGLTLVLPEEQLVGGGVELDIGLDSDVYLYRVRDSDGVGSNVLPHRNDSNSSPGY